jgi:hypothetical protein
MSVAAPFKGTVGPNSQTNGKAQFSNPRKLTHSQNTSPENRSAPQCDSALHFKREKHAPEKCAAPSSTKEGDKAANDGKKDGKNCGSEKSNKTISVDRLKQIDALRQNVARFITLAPPDRYVFLVLTVAKTIKERELSKRLEKLQRCVFTGYVAHYLRLTEYQSRGAPHVHILAITDKPGEYGIPDIRKRLRKSARRCGFGEWYARPVRNLEALPAYFTKMFRNGALPARRRGERPHLISYSRGWPKAATTKFAWNTPNGILWRRKKAAFALSYGCRTWEKATRMLGPGWEYRYRASITEQQIN